MVIFKKGGLGMKLASERRNKGAIISFVDENGQASEKGLQPGDRMLKVDGARVWQKSMEDIVTAISKSKRPCKYTFTRPVTSKN